MRAGRFLLTLALSLALASQANAQIKVRYIKGAPIFVSAMPASGVELVVPPPSRDRHIIIFVVALNRSSQPESLGYENVSIRTASGLPIKLQTYDDLQHSAHVRAGWATFFAVLAAGANGYLAERSAYGSSYGSAYTSTPYGGFRTSYASTYYSPVAAQMALDRAGAQDANMFESISNALDSTLAQLDQTVLRTTTIDPGRGYGGGVVFDLPHGVTVDDLTVTVSFAGDVHTVSLNASAQHLQQASEAELRPPVPPAVAPSDLTAPIAQDRAQQPNVSTSEPPKPARNCRRSAIWSPTAPDAVEVVGGRC